MPRFSEVSNRFSQVGGKYEIIQLPVLSIQDVVPGAFPPLLTIIKKNDFIADLHHRVHVMGVDDGGGLKIFG